MLIRATENGMTTAEFEAKRAQEDALRVELLANVRRVLFNLNEFSFVD